MTFCRSRDRGEVDLSVVDSVENVGEDRRRECEADLDQLTVAGAGRFDRRELLVADGLPPELENATPEGDTQAADTRSAAGSSV